MCTHSNWYINTHTNITRSFCRASSEALPYTLDLPMARNSQVPLQNNISAQNIRYLSFDLPTLSNRLSRNTSLLFFPGNWKLNQPHQHVASEGFFWKFFTELHLFVGPPHSSFTYHRVLSSF